VTAPVLHALELAFSYPDSTLPIIRGFSLTVERSEVVAVQGPSGSGKSTLLFLLGLLIKPSAGRIVLLGEETHQLGDADRSRLRAHHVGFVLQDAALHPTWTVEENVAEGAIYSGTPYETALQQARSLLASTGIAHVANRWPTQISGGEAQRAALCRALVRTPALVLADEPTGNLDPANAGAVLAGLRGAARTGAAVVVVTHNEAVASACDRVLRLA
jgi:ABC-type lipoprotein export system ATPase subunit